MQCCVGCTPQLPSAPLWGVSFRKERGFGLGGAGWEPRGYGGWWPKGEGW